MKWTSGLLRLTPYRLKMLGVLLALLVLVFITALSVFYARFDPEQVRMQLADALQTDGRTLSIGQISPAVFPRPGIKIDQISLSAPNASPDGDGPLFTLRRAEIRLAWLPLLQAQKVVHAIKLDGVRLNLRREADGRWNFADLLEQKTASSLVVKLDSLKLADLNATVDDRVFKREFSLSEGSMEASGMLGNAQLSLAGLLKSGEHQAAVVLESPLNVAEEQLTLDPFKLTATGLVAGLTDSRAELSGTVRVNLVSRQMTAENLQASLSSREPSVSLTARMPSADWSQGKAGFQAPSLDFNAALNNKGSSYSFSGQLKDISGNWQALAATELTGAMSWKAGEHTLTAQLKAPVTLSNWEIFRLTPVTVDTTLATPLLPRGQLKAAAKGELVANLARQQVTSKLNGQIDGQRFDFNARQDGFITPAHTVNLSLGKLDLNRYLAESTGNQVGLFYGQRKFDFDWMNALNLSGDLRIAELTAGRFAMQQIGAKLSMRPEKLLLEDVTALIYGGNLNGRLELTPGEQPKLVMFETLSGMRIRPLLRDLFDIDRLDGKGRLEATLTAEGQTFTQLRKSLNGTVRVGLTEGALMGVDMVEEAIKRLPTELARLTDDPSKRTDFQSLSAQFNFSNGVARNHDLRLNSSLFSLQGHGKVDLVGNIIDYAMRVQPNILVFTNTKEMNVPLKITGALNAPTYALDFNALVKDKKTILEKQQVLKEQLSNQFNLFKTTP